MRVILNSDVLHTPNRLLTKGLSRHILEFCNEVAATGSILVLPSTVMMKNERGQRKLSEDTAAKLNSASALLNDWGIIVPQFDAAQTIGTADLATVLRATGTIVEVHAPTLEDFRDAERRASLHLPPQAPEAKSDEMRDLVIWAVALRLAKQDGGAILVSRDEVHVHDCGSEEAGAVRLRRVKNFEDAQDLLSRMSPSIQLATSVLSTVWGELRSAGLPLPDKVPLRRFSDLEFTADDAGHANTSLSFEISTAEGPLAGSGHIRHVAPSTIQVDLTGLRLAGTPWRGGTISHTVDGELPTFTKPVEQRLPVLQRAVEEGR